MASSDAPRVATAGSSTGAGRCPTAPDAHPRRRRGGGPRRGGRAALGVGLEAVWELGARAAAGQGEAARGEQEAAHPGDATQDVPDTQAQAALG